MIALFLAAAVQVPPSVVLRTAPGSVPARYVRMHMKLEGYGISGDGTLLIDRKTGRYAQYLGLGPQTLHQGFDGTNAWQADVKGTTAVQGNSIDGAVVRAWGDLFAFSRRSDAPGRVLLDPQNHRVVRFTMWNGSFNELAAFADYHTFSGGIAAPRSITFSDDNGTWKANVTGIDALSGVAQNAFEPPARQDDSSIVGGRTSVPFLIASEIIIPVRINDGPVMHFILDTGGQNLLTTQSVKTLGIKTEGSGTVGGAGAGLVPTTFATIRSVRIGRAVMRDQPFLVISSSVLNGVDGIVGYELLSRFAARIDYRTNTLTLASSMPESWAAGVQPTPFVFASRAPQITGKLDPFPGQMVIDTGNSGVLDVNAPFADEHDLWSYYGAAKPKKGNLAGVGGVVLSSNITVRRLNLGGALVEDVHGTLTQATAGAESNPSVAANLGEGVFRNFSFVVDYPHQRVYFAPGGIHDMSGVLFERHGNTIVVSGLRTNHAREAGIRVGMALTALNGRSVSGSDMESVEKQLRDQEPGSTAEMVFDGTKRVTVRLLNYL